MERFLEKISETAKMKIMEELDGWTLEELAGLTNEDLKTLLGLSTKEILFLKRETGGVKKRPRDEPSSSEDEGAKTLTPGDQKNLARLALEGLVEDPLGLRDLLPTRWDQHNPISVRAILAPLAAKVESNPHLRQELEFLQALVASPGTPENQQVLVWGRLVQLSLKAFFPAVATEIAGVWAASLSRLSTFSELDLTRHVWRVYTEVKKQAATREAAKPKKLPPAPFRPNRFTNHQKRN